MDSQFCANKLSIILQQTVIRSNTKTCITTNSHKVQHNLYTQIPQDSNKISSSRSRIPVGLQQTTNRRKIGQGVWTFCPHENTPLVVHTYSTLWLTQRHTSHMQMQANVSISLSPAGSLSPADLMTTVMAGTLTQGP